MQHHESGVAGGAIKGLVIPEQWNHDGGFYEGRYDESQEWFITGEGLTALDDYPDALQYYLYTGTDMFAAVSADGTGDWTCEAEFSIYDSFPIIRKILTSFFIEFPPS